MPGKKTGKISTLGSQVTSVISVTLVLLIVGLLCCMYAATRKAASNALGDVTMIVKLDVMASADEAKEIDSLVRHSAYASEVTFTPKEQVLAQEMEYNAEILELLGENPYGDELEVRLQSAYAHPDSINAVANVLLMYGSVSEVVSQADVVAQVRQVSGKLAAVLGAVAAALLAISLVLIYNTVSLAVYARRFVIRTMQLVGATPGFIRRPFVQRGLCWGLVSGLLASGLLSAGLAWAHSTVAESAELLGWRQIGIISAVVTALGVAICGIAALMATTRYLRATTESLYQE